MPLAYLLALKCPGRGPHADPPQLLRRLNFIIEDPHEPYPPLPYAITPYPGVGGGGGGGGGVPVLTVLMEAILKVSAW